MLLFRGCSEIPSFGVLQLVESSHPPNKMLTEEHVSLIVDVLEIFFFDSGLLKKVRFQVESEETSNTKNFRTFFKINPSKMQK